MIYLHTGLPGAGKTLCTLSEVKARSEKENRSVYFFNITDLKLPWIELKDGKEWDTVPDGSIIVIDEAQVSFRPRHTGSSVPPYIAAFETHRHRGLDVYLITQHPKLIDANIRRLVGNHVHFVRAFGAKAVVRHEWGEVQEDPQARGDSTSKLVPYPKDAFDYYKSAEIHTHKVRIPARLWLLAGIPVLIAALAWFAVSNLSNLSKGTPDELQPKQSPALVSTQQPTAKHAKTTAQWLEERVPRVPSLAYTAPVYDEVTKPVTAPYPAACVSMGPRCSCYTQQGTYLDVPKAFCLGVVERGFFVDWDTGKASQKAPGYGGGDLSPHARPSLNSPPIGSVSQPRNDI